jgi:hypothetical protein
MTLRPVPTPLGWLCAHCYRDKSADADAGSVTPLTPQEMSAAELRAALIAAGDGKTDATALLQEWYDRYGSSPPGGTYSLSATIRLDDARPIRDASGSFGRSRRKAHESRGS